VCVCVCVKTKITFTYLGSKGNTLHIDEIQMHKLHIDEITYIPLFDAHY